MWSTVLCYPRPNLELQPHTTAFMSLCNLKYLYKCNFMNSFLEVITEELKKNDVSRVIVGLCNHSFSYVVDTS